MTVIVQGQAQLFLSPEELKPGMKGYGLSVFSGWESEKFDVEIIDVMKNVSPGGSVILARLKGQGLETSGVIAGMSGSPVYIDGKLIGAVALGWPFSKEPICGITPIGEMLGEKRNSLESPSTGTADEGSFRRIRTPLSFSGFSAEARSFAGTVIGTNLESPFILAGSETVSGKSPGSGRTKLKAGDAVSVNLVDGDFSVQGVGTVTYVSNDDVYIFGHPMDLAGGTGLPISRSYIYSVIPSSQISFKLGSSSEPIGVARYDGQHALYCQLGSQGEAMMVPVDLRVEKAGASSAGYDYHFRVADNRNYFPSLTTAAVSSALMNHTGNYDDKQIAMDFRIKMTAGKKELTVSNRFLYALNPSYFSLYSMLGDLNQYLSFFYNNNFGEVRVKSVSVKVTIRPENRYDTIEYFSVDKPSYYPGEKIRCKVVMREYRGGYVTRDLVIPVPDNASGQYWVMAGSEMTFNGEVNKLFPKYYSISSMDDLVRMANLGEDASLLTVGLIAPRPGLQVQENRMEKFPENYLSYFNRTGDKNTQPVYPEIVRASEQLEEAVFGTMRVSISVISKTIQTAE
jgi:hypothetical protein